MFMNGVACRHLNLCMTSILLFLQVENLFQELDKILPNNFMSQTFEDPSARLVSAIPPSSNLTQAQLEVGPDAHPSLR